MSQVVYRSMLKEDYNCMKEFIGNAFGFNKFIEDKDLLDVVLGSYLQSCISESSFSKICEKDGKVIGFILGGAKVDKNNLKCDSKDLFNNVDDVDLILSNDKNIKELNEFSKVISAYKELIGGIEDEFQGSINLFIVSKESRGLGVGKTLVKYLNEYMKSMDVESLYLYTDDKCNYEFYNSQGYTLVNEKDVYLNNIKSHLNVFLYRYDF